MRNGREDAGLGAAFLNRDDPPISVYLPCFHRNESWICLPASRIPCPSPEEALNSFGDFEQGLVGCLQIDELLGKLVLTAAESVSSSSFLSIVNCVVVAASSWMRSAGRLPNASFRGVTPLQVTVRFLAVAAAFTSCLHVAFLSVAGAVPALIQLGMIFSCVSRAMVYLVPTNGAISRDFHEGFACYN